MVGQMVTIPPAPRVKTRVKVAAYCRVSDLTGRLPGSLAAQVAHFHSLIASTPGWEEASVYSDLGITGTSTTHRDGFNAMMDAARAGAFEILLVKSISRLARNTVDLLATIRELTALGVSVRFERENINTSTASGELLLTLLASFAQEESRSLSENVKWAIRKRFEAGGTNSFVLFGYTWTGTGFVIKPDEADIIRRIFRDYLAGISPEKIADALNAEDAPSRYGGAFCGSVIRRWLENPRFKGCELLQKTYNHTPRGKRIRNEGEHPRYWVEDALPAIIDEPTWQAVQDELAARRDSGGRALTPTGGTGALTHKVICSVCARRFHRRTKTRRHLTYKFWWCESATRGQGNPCHAPQIRETHLQAAIATALGWDTYDPALVHRLIQRITVSPTRRITVHTTSGQVASADLPEATSPKPATAA